MGQLGIGVMIHALFGGTEDTVKAIQEAIGKTIQQVTLEEKCFLLWFSDGMSLGISDDGQSCCESRYMRTDDDLSVIVGATFQGAEIRKAPNEPDEYGEHEVQFLLITTSAGVVTIANHNEHNGYYGGFWLCAKLYEQ